MLIFYTYANFVMILELDLVPCPLEWNQANGELTKVAKNYTAAAACCYYFHSYIAFDSLAK